MRKTYALILGALQIAFVFRVLGQLLVAWFDVAFLPPMSQWYSGVVPYHLLLPLQCVILVVQAKIAWDIWLSKGYFAIRRPQVGTILYWFSIVYFFAMVVRYVLTMYLYPERRWFGGTIPIAFHWVLAAYLFVLGRYQRSATVNDE